MVRNPNIYIGRLCHQPRFHATGTPAGTFVPLIGWADLSLAGGNAAGLKAFAGRHWNRQLRFAVVIAVEMRVCQVMQQLGLPIEERFAAAIADARGPSGALFAALDGLPAPVYAVDGQGTVIYANAACTPFAGRQPEPGRDRWCISWKLYSDNGVPMAHDECPLAEAVRKRRAIQFATAIAERPDGTRVRFLPYPVPLIDQSGYLRGGVNMLIDLSGGRYADGLRIQAERCRRLALEVSDQMVSQTLAALGDEYDAKAAKISRLI